MPHYRGSPARKAPCSFMSLWAWREQEGRARRVEKYGVLSQSGEKCLRDFLPLSMKCPGKAFSLGWECRCEEEHDPTEAESDSESFQRQKWTSCAQIWCGEGSSSLIQTATQSFSNACGWAWKIMHRYVSSSQAPASSLFGILSRGSPPCTADTCNFLCFNALLSTYSAALAFPLF